MIKYSCHRGMFPRLIWQLIAVAIVLSPVHARAQTQWERIATDNPAFSLEAPDGWEMREVEGRGARLVPPEDGPVVEIVAWNALRPPATPEKAAVEHEAVLSRAVDYRRDNVEQIETDAGSPALVVTGRVRSHEITESSLFCAYARGATHYVVGTFATEAELADLRAGVLDRMMRSFRPEAGADPATRPPQPVPQPEPVEPAPPAVEPQPDTEPREEPDEPDTPDEPRAPEEAQPGEAPTTMEVGGQTEPIGPEPRETRAPWIQHISPTGFSVSMPMDWEVSTVEGVITLRPAVQSARDSTAIIWPVFGQDPGARDAVRQAVARIPEMDIERVSSVREADGATVIEGRTGDARFVATWSHQDGFGLLRAAVIPGERWSDDLPDIARMAASFRPGRWRVAHRARVDVTGDHGLVRCRLPEGWQLRGGVRDDAGEVALDIEALGPPGDELRVGWQQPIRPRFRALTALLESLGWREGERYSVPEGGGGLLIYRRREPQKLVRDLLMKRHPRQLRLMDIDTEPVDSAISDLLPGADATGRVVTVSGGSAIGPRERIYLAATARSEGALASTCWEAAALRADAPEGELARAINVLVTMVRSASATPRADEQGAEALTQLIERARRAAAAIPEDLLRGATGKLTGVLAGDPPTSGPSAWQVPAGAGEWWSRQAEDEASGDVLGRPLGTRPD